MKIKKDDSVKVISGNDKGKIGRVVKVFPKKERLIVESINMVKKHLRPTEENPQGGIQEKEASIHISNVKLVVNNEATRIGYKILEDGNKVRYAKKTGEVID